MPQTYNEGLVRKFYIYSSDEKITKKIQNKNEVS